ncbi:MAG: glycosyl transferase [Planctomycetes bacterium]|nr:glycosyl transferase [Planctomycetota bacterium]
MSEPKSAQEPMRVFVGTDESQMVATKVLEYSIRRHASAPVEVVPMRDLPIPVPADPANRPRTGFSLFRFVIPELAGYRGRALYLDADMHVFTDIAELWRIPFGEDLVLCTCQPEPPPAWRHHAFFRPGRQFSVMLLDCDRLDWDIAKIVANLDAGAFTYPQLLFEMCVVPDGRVGDRIPREWNCLEHYDLGRTKLLHYTVVPTQPWKNDQNPLRYVWEREFEDAVAAGAVPEELVQEGVAKGHLKRSLLDAFLRRPRTQSASLAGTASA